MPNGNVDIGKLIEIGEAVALDIFAWWERRHAEGLAPPNDTEVIARAKAKVLSIVNEGQQALNEFPEGS